MFCGSRSFSHVDEDSWSAPSTPKTSSSRKREKNPYATRGLDKFSMVLAELEARREKILASTEAKDVSLVRFTSNNSQDWVPIIVRLREDQKRENLKEIDDKKALPAPPPPPAATQKDSEAAREATQAITALSKDTARVKRSFSWGVKDGESGAWWRWKPSYCWPMLMVLILLCLMMSGRVFAICCTSIWWYLVPTMQGGTGDKRRRSLKKDYGRRLSDKNLGGNTRVAPSSQANKGGGVQELSSPRNHHHVNGKRG